MKIRRTPSLARTATAAGLGLGLAVTTLLSSGAAQAAGTADGPSATTSITVGDPVASTGAPTGALGYALTADRKVATFALADPTKTTSVAITGIPSTASIVGIDERPKTGALYAVVKNADATGTAYTVNPATGAASKAFDLKGITGPLTLNGTRFGVDFNPVADALRITSDRAQNLRALPSDRIVAGVARLAGDTFVDGILSYDPLSAPTRTPAAIDASAYTNNLAAPTATQLFNIDSVRSQLTLQNPPNDGTQAPVAAVSLAGRPVSGFDITTLGTTNTAYVATQNNLVTAKVSNPLEKLLVSLGLAKPRQDTLAVLAKIDLATGALTPVNNFITNAVLDIAVDTPAP